MCAPKETPGIDKEEFKARALELLRKQNDKIYFEITGIHTNESVIMVTVVAETTPDSPCEGLRPYLVSFFPNGEISVGMQPVYHPLRTEKRKETTGVLTPFRPKEKKD